MKLLLFIFLFFGKAHAADCLKEYFNYNTGLKFTYSFNDLYENHKPDPNLNFLCKDKNKNEGWEIERKARKEAFEEKRDEMIKGHKISSGDLELRSDDSVYIAESEVCTRMDKAIKEKENCYEPPAYAGTLRKTDILSMTFEQACLKLGPEIVRRIKVCRYKN